MDRRRAMVADDDEAMRGALALVLDLLGFDVFLFDDGDSLTAAALAAEPDLIVTDEHMARWNGTTALGHLRSHGVICPAIVLTAFPDPAVTARVLALGGCQLLGKPVDLEVLNLAIRGEG